MQIKFESKVVGLEWVGVDDQVRRAIMSELYCLAPSLASYTALAKYPALLTRLSGRCSMCLWSP